MVKDWSFPLRSRTRWDAHFCCFYHHCTEILARVIQQEKEIKVTILERKLLRKDIILHVENPKDYTKENKKEQNNSGKL